MINKISALFLFISVVFSAQKKLSLQECESEFQKNNLQILIENYHLSIADAQIIQSKIWELPVASIQLNAYNPNNKTPFDFGQSKGAQLSQLIYLGGKKKNEVAFAKSNKDLAQLQFNQLLIDLRTQLRTIFYNLYFENKKQNSIATQLGYMTDLLKAYKVQTNKGNVSLKDQVRLQSIVIQLNNDKIEINNAIVGLNQKLQVITGIPEPIHPLVSDDEIKRLLANQAFGNVEVLKEKAMENNADYLYGLKLIDNSKLYATWQKSLNVPDLNLGLSWDQNGGTYRNEFNLNIGIPIPLWKANKGNVQKANYSVEQSLKSAEFQKITLLTQVDSAYQIWKNQYEQFTNMDPTDLDNLNIVYQGILKNFRNGNVSLMEFTDFMESYRQTVLQVYEMKKQIMLSAEQLNQLVQAKIFY